MSLNKELNIDVNENAGNKLPSSGSVLSNVLGELDVSNQPPAEIYKPTSPIGFEVKKHIKPEAIPTSGWGETVGSFYRHNDPLFNYAKYIDNAFNTNAELAEMGSADFDPLALLPNYPTSMWRNLATSSTKGEFYRKAVSMGIDDEDLKVLDNASWYTALSAGAVGSVANPFYALAGEAIVSNSLLKGGLAGVVQGAVTGITAELATEGVLLGTQEQRKLEESMWNVGVSGIAGSLLGGLGGAIRSAKYPIYKQMIESQLNGEAVHFGIEAGKTTHFNVYDKSTGALKKRIDLHGEQLLGLNSKGQYSAATPFIWFAGKATQNPVIKVLTGKSPYAAKFINGWLEHSMDVVGNVVHGKNMPTSVQRKIGNWTAKNLQGNKLVVDGYMEYLGNQPGMSVKNIMARNFAPPPGMLNIAEFSKQLYYPIITGKVHESSVVQKISMQIQKQMFEPVAQGLVDVGKLKPDIKLSTAAGHITRLYDVPHMNTYPAQTKEFFYNSFVETRAHVLEATQGLRTLQDEISQLKSAISGAVDDKLKAQLQKQLKTKQRARLKEDNRLYALQHDGHYDGVDPAMVVGDKGQSPKDLLRLKQLRKPVKKFKSLIADKEAALRVAKSEKQAKEVLKKLEADVEAAKKQLKEYRKSLVEKRDAGTLPAEFFRGDYLRKPNRGTLGFRAWASDADLKIGADSMFNTITGNNAANFADEMLGFSGGGSNEGFLKSRTNMISDEKLYNSGIMITDIRKNIAAMNSRGGRVIEIAKYFQENAIEVEGKTYIQALADSIQNDYAIQAEDQAKRFRELKAGKSGAELAKIEKLEAKEAQALVKNQKSVQATVADSFIRIAGTSHVKHEKLTRVAKFSNDWANGSQLGALSTLLPQDIVAPLFRNGVSWFTEGPGAFVGNLIKGASGDNKLLREQAADLLLGCDLEQAYYSQAFQSLDANIDVPTSGFERLVAKAPTAMGIISGSTFLNDIGQRWGVTSTASKANRAMRKLVDGTISKNEAIWLRGLGLGDVDIAKDLIGYIDKHGESMSGGMYMNWGDWDKGLVDAGEIRKAQMARNLMQESITKNVRSVSFSGVNPASYPAGLPINPIMSAILPYMGWIFNAQANYMIPLLQRFDPNKVIGFFAMTAMASLSDPLREMAAGKDVNLDPGTLLKKGLLGGGFLGVAGDIFNKANTAGNIFPSLKVDRYERKGIEVFGPLVGALQTGFKAFGMVRNNDYNKKDIAGMLNALPLVKAIEFRYAMKQFIDSLDLPERRTTESNE